jgi:hypothetical protein
VPLLYPVLVFVDDFEKLISKAAPNQKEDKVELTTSNAIVILGSSFVGSLAFTYSDSFGLMLWKQKFTLWLLFISLLFLVRFTLGTRHGLPRGNRWLLIIIGYWTVFWVHFMALLTIPSIGLLYFFKHYKTVTVKTSSLPTL